MISSTVTIYCGGTPSCAGSPFTEFHPERLLRSVRAAVKIAGWLSIPIIYQGWSGIFIVKVEESGGREGGGRLVLSTI